MRDAHWLHDEVFTIENFLSAQECARLIQLCEEMGFEESRVSSPQGSVRRTEVRNNQRVMFADAKLAQQFWQRSSDFLPEEIDGRRVVGINEMFRCYRYDVGEHFRWHQDFSYERDNGERSLLTLMVYLNDDFTGGETSFEDSYSPEPFEEFQVVPRAGLGLCFLHSIHHQGEPILSGRKYVIRTDVMYSAEPEEPEDWEDDWEEQ